MGRGVMWGENSRKEVFTFEKEFSRIGKTPKLGARMNGQTLLAGLVLSNLYIVETLRIDNISEYCGGLQFSSVQSLSCVWLFATPWTAAHQVSLSITNSRSLLKLTSMNWWCHPTISASVTLFSCPQSFPASGSFQMSQFFSSGGQSIGVSALASVLPMNIQGYFL